MYIFPKCGLTLKQLVKQQEIDKYKEFLFLIGGFEQAIWCQNKTLSVIFHVSLLTEREAKALFSIIEHLQVFDGWILKGEKFPSSLDHPLPTSERYIDFCESGNIQKSIRSSQNVAMIFFRIHQPGNGFTITVKKNTNLFRKSAFYTI